MRSFWEAMGGVAKFFGVILIFAFVLGVLVTPYLWPLVFLFVAACWAWEKVFGDPRLKPKPYSPVKEAEQIVKTSPPPPPKSSDGRYTMVGEIKQVLRHPAGLVNHSSPPHIR